MVFSLSQLEYIVAVDTYRSFSEAAQRCYVTQPTLSMQIQKMEDLLGTTLFDRSRQPIMPTEIGRKVIDQGKVVLKESTRIEEIIATEHGEISGEFHIGVIPTVASYLLPRFLSDFQKKYPKVDLLVDEMKAERIIRLLNSDRLDAGLLVTPVGETRIVEKPLYYENFMLYLSEKHPLLENDTFLPKKITQDDLLLMNEGYTFREQVLHLCQKRPMKDKKAKSWLATSDLEILKKFVDEGQGMTVLPELMTGEFEEKYRQRVRAFQGPSPCREVSIVYTRALLKQSIIQAFTESLQSSLPIEMLTKDSRYVVPVTLS